MRMYPPRNVSPSYCLICLLILILATLPTRADAQTITPIPKSSEQPVIDGDEDVAWEAIAFLSIRNVYGGVIANPQDFSAAWKAMWDDTNLYFLFEINDDALFNLGSGASKYWIHDCVEIFFDLLNDKDQVDTDENPHDDNYQYRFIWDLDDEPLVEAPPVQGMSNVSKTRIEGTDTLGYHIEVMIPWATLIQEHAFGAVETGKLVGTELKVADLDTPSVPSGVWAPEAELLWNNTTIENLKVTAMFGSLQLVNTLTGDLSGPTSITNLSGTAAGSSSVSLVWSAPADENTGRAAGYLLAYDIDSLTVANWTDANHFHIDTLPGMPGVDEQIQMDSLDAGTTYYFAVRSLDAFDNLSDLSNIAKVKTFDPDLLAPDPISDLAIDSSSSFMAELTWTSTGDDGTTGTATRYDVRIHNETLTPENWESANPAEGLPLPLEAGQTQSFRVHGLTPENTYFFGIRAVDETPNYGDISNVVELATPPFTYAVKHPVDQMIGTNSFIDVPMENMEAVGFIREYHPWSFTEIEDDVFEYNRWNGFWDFDAYYSDLKQLGITVCPALWSSPAWLESNATNKPCGDDEDPEDPASYSEMAQFIYQYGARYGNTEVVDEKLLVNAGQVKKSGMGVLSYFEDWNEQDRDWEGRDAQFIAEEYAAMASANVDGHAGVLGDGFGLKTADPTARFVMGGLYILGTDYITAMYNWFIDNRSDHRWPIDVINMHHYSYTNEKNGICPEQDGYKAMVQEVIDWRNEYAPENEVWITEFGYDTNDESPNRINPFGGFTQQEIQAQWIVRTNLLLTSAGVDRAAQFMIRDVDPNPEPRWSDSGLTLSPVEGNIPKTSWYYTYTMKNTFMDMYFDKVISESSSAYVYRFVNESGDKYVYALWSPTGDGSSSVYRLKIAPNPSSLKKIELRDGSTTGITTVMETSSDQVSLDISESPLFVVADYGEPTGGEIMKEQAGIMVYPNPFSGIIRLDLPFDSKGTQITLYSQDGRAIRSIVTGDSGPSVSMDLGDLERGLYFMHARKGNQVVTEKIVKQ